CLQHQRYRFHRRHWIVRSRWTWTGGCIRTRLLAEREFDRSGAVAAAGPDFLRRGNGLLTGAEASAILVGSHPFPFRTRSLRIAKPMILLQRESRSLPASN